MCLLLLVQSMCSFSFLGRLENPNELLLFPVLTNKITIHISQKYTQNSKKQNHLTWTVCLVSQQLNYEGKKVMDLLDGLGWAWSHEIENQSVTLAQLGGNQGTEFINRTSIFPRLRTPGIIGFL